MASSIFQEAIRRFDQENARDPHQELADGAPHPREMLYARRLTTWVERLCPHPSESLLLATRAQHLCRWEIPRDRYPKTRSGYLQWRETLKKYHAEKASKILQEVGYPPHSINRVVCLIAKRTPSHDPEAQVLEDAVCLQFLEFQFEDFCKEVAEEKMLGILQKTWNKMSTRGQEEALKLPLNSLCKELLGKALASR